MPYRSIDALVGKTLAAVERSSDELLFTTMTGEKYRMFHIQDCCESVAIEEIIGDFFLLIGSPIVVAEERTQDDPDASETAQWTFYTIRTNKDTVTIRWYGASDYYSISVDFEQVQ